MVKWLKLYATYTYSASPSLRHRTTSLNTDVPNCHIVFVCLSVALRKKTTQLIFENFRFLVISDIWANVSPFAEKAEVCALLSAIL